MTYKTRSIALAIALNLALFSIGFLWQARSKAAHEFNALTAVQNLAELLTRDMEARFDGIDKALLAVSDEYERQTATGKISAAELNVVIARQLSRQPDLFTMRITNAQGEQLYGIEGKTAPNGSSLSDRKYFRAHQSKPDNGLLISDPLLGKITGKWGIVFSRRLNHRDGSFAGIVYGQVGLELLGSRFSNLRLGKDGSIALRDAQLGMVVRYPQLQDSASVGANTISTDFREALQAHANAGNYLSGTTSIDGIPRVHSYRKLPHYPFYLNVGIAKGTFLMDWRRDTVAVLLIWLVFAGSTAVGTYLLLQEWTRRERGVDALARSEARFRSIIEASPVPFALNDDAGRITYLNSAFTQTFGYQQQDIPTLPDWFEQAYPDPTYRQWVLSTWEKRLASAQGQQTAFDPMEVKIRCNNGLAVTVMASAAMLESAPDDTHLVVLYDISSRKRVEQQLKVSEARLTRAELTSKSGNWELNIHSQEVVASEGAERIYGVKANGLTLDAIQCIPLLEYRAAMDMALHALIERDAIYDIEFQIRAADSGVIKDIHSVAFFDREHGIVFGVIQDITERKRTQKALLDSELFARSTLDAVSEHLCVLDKDGTVISTNQSWRRFYDDNDGVHDTSPYGVGRNYLEVCDLATGECAEEAAQMARGIRSVMRKESDFFSLEYACSSPTEQRWFQVRVTPFLGGSDNIVVAHEDITEHKLVQARLQMAASVFTHAREGITIADAKGVIMDVNDTFTHITGYSRAEAIGKNPRVLKSGRHPPEFYESMWGSIQQEGYWSGEIWNRRKSGEIYPELLTISAVKDSAGSIVNYVALFSDIAAIKRYQDQLEHLAHFDRLTGLPNRMLKDDRLRQAMLTCQRRETRLAVAYIDLDGFKAVNDLHGHDVGDQLLTKVSQRMKEALREGDTLARVGGDEFVAILVDLASMEDCIPVLNRLLLAASNPVHVGQATLQVSASIGVSTYPQDEADATTLTKQADQAMYQAKQKGKNRFELFAGPTV